MAKQSNTGVQLWSAKLRYCRSSGTAYRKKPLPFVEMQFATPKLSKMSINLV
ncbi:MAG: hypothetical protein PHO85_03260 [Candidatus Cloacimonetes bacterium]|nr:hypothetical protein [Candidatus Cloacimonadota bacterium]